MIFDSHEHHDPGTPGAWPVELVLLAPFLLAACLYLCAVAAQSRRGRPWPWYRSVLWVLGLAAASTGFAGPLTPWSHATFTGHMVTHLLVGMVAPLLLMLAAPATLALRTLAVVPARRVSRLLNSIPARILTHPLVATVLNIGGIWVLYRTPLFDAMQNNVLAHWLAMSHFLVVGYLYTVSFVSIDPAPHRPSFPFRASVLVLSLAAHGAIAKSLYAYPPQGLNIADVRQGAELMYYGGDAVDLVIIVLLCAEWYRYAGRVLRRGNARNVPSRTGLSPAPGH